MRDGADARGGAMTPEERRAIIVKFLAVGYKGLDERERMVVAYVVTVGGCHACPRS